MLDADSLRAIALEARQCFLLEDAPDFIGLFNQSVKALQQELNQPSGGDREKLYKNLVRAAHSIKGGAGLAEMQGLYELAHQMEDLLEAMAEGRIKDQWTGLELVTLAMEEAQHCIDLAVANEDNSGENAGLTELTVALGEFLCTAEPVAPLAESSNSAPSKFIAISLQVDLEACVQRLEDMLSPQTPDRILALQLKTLEEECRLLGEALGLPWLEEVAAILSHALTEPLMPPLELGQQAIAEIRYLVQAYLSNPQTVFITAGFQQLRPPTVTQHYPPEPRAIATNADTNPDLIPSELEVSPPATKQTSSLQVRLPIEQLNRMGNAVGELFIGYEKLSRQHQQLLQASRKLKQRTQQLNPIRDEVITLYDKLAVAAATGNKPQSLDPKLDAPVRSNSEFDRLHFDQYTQAHSNLQQFQEVMVQVQELREDIELIRWEFQNSLESIRQQLEYLNQDLTQSRLVPFGNLARRFGQSIATLSQRYPQSAKLQIEGEQVLVDQAILEQLRTPLTHLIRNAFDHGIEPPLQRRQNHKPEVGTITLGAKLYGNTVEIQVRDDGNGVDVEQVWQKAVALGLYEDNASDRPTDEEMLDFIFAPGFSTRQKVSDLSGRGMGLDIVRLELEQLKGTVSVTSKPKQGTQFTIRIPLSFNILPLLLCRCQQQAIAIPSVNIQGIVSLATKDPNQAPPEFVDWQGKHLKIYPLDELLPYNQSNIFLPPDQRPQPMICVVVLQGTKPVAIAVDEILGERELVLKSFDQSVAYPPYLAGCTVLGTGEVIPVLVPDAFDQLIDIATAQLRSPNPMPQPTTMQRQPAILVIDDSVAVRRTLDKLLTQSGYQVQQCRDGKEAWNLLNRSNQTFDLAICDLEMPGYDGFSLLQMVRAQHQWDKLPFVMLTSRDNDLHRQKAKDLGANDYFTKPFHPVRFLEAIAQYLEAN